MVSALPMDVQIGLLGKLQIVTPVFTPASRQALLPEISSY
jgi:hypothetical protein